MSNGMHRTRPESLWHHMDFMRFWAGQSVSQLGSAVTTIALPLTAITVLRASALLAAPSGPLPISFGDLVEEAVGAEKV